MFFYLQNACRSALEALIMGAGSEEAFKFTGRYRSDYAAMASPSARQIYLTFPADSTFKEEDVSNYFRFHHHLHHLLLSSVFVLFVDLDWFWFEF